VTEVGRDSDAIGARVAVTVGEAAQVREVKAGSSYLGQNDTRVHFGLGTASRRSAEVRWPGAADRRPSGRFRPVQSSPLSKARASPGGSPFASEQLALPVIDEARAYRPWLRRRMVVGQPWAVRRAVFAFPAGHFMRRCDGCEAAGGSLER
jgi:hypothetical protein